MNHPPRSLRCPSLSAWVFLGLSFFQMVDAPRALAARSGEMTHVILITLQRPGNSDDRNVVIRLARQLRRARGVTDLRFGPTYGSNTDSGFDLAVVLTFRNERSLRRFEEDQQANKSFDRALGRLVRREMTYNLVNQ